MVLIRPPKMKDEELQRLIKEAPEPPKRQMPEPPKLPKQHMIPPKEDGIKAEEQRPRVVTENLFTEPKPWYKFWGSKEPEVIPEPETIEPILLLMKENGYTDTIHNVKTGEFIISTPKGEKSIWLTPDKFTTIKMGGRYYKGWIAYENCMTPYPEDPMFSSELNRKIIQRIAINYRDLNDAAVWSAKTKFWLWIIGGLMIGAVLLFSTDFGKQLLANFGKPAAQAATEAVKQAAANVTKATAGVP